MSAVVSDTSPLRYLIECGVPEILHALFGEIIIPPAVFAELQKPRTPATVRDWIEARPQWIKIQSPASIMQHLNLDAGEREAISLAKEIGATVILIDDRRGRAEAHRCGLMVSGTIGILERAARERLVDFKIIIERLRSTNARLDADVIDSALVRLGLQ